MSQSLVGRLLSRAIASEVSMFTRYFDRVIQWAPTKGDEGYLLECIDAPIKERVESDSAVPDLRDEKDKRTALLLNGNLNYSFDIQGLLEEIKNSLSRTSRIVVVAYNPYMRTLVSLANRLGLHRGEVPTTFLTRPNLLHLGKLAGFEVVKQRSSVFLPLPFENLSRRLNRFLSLIPGMRLFSAVEVIVLRPQIAESKNSLPSLSIIIPARNEKGNIENAIRRLPELGADLEIIFVEGHSSDGTWEEIERVQKLYQSSVSIKSFKQLGKGKADAVRLGATHATKDLITILDADLTMPPELLPLFYQAYCLGQADFINGNRLLYPMEGEAMRFLNHLGNLFFAKALSGVLEVSIGDSLCGTKLFSRTDYQRFVRWRAHFGEFDPFGDFELLFPAAILGLGIIDIPVRYRARTYGSTNISRFRHGAMLLKMTMVGFFRVRVGDS